MNATLRLTPSQTKTLETAVQTTLTAATPQFVSRIAKSQRQI